ncbi:MAG: RNA polymerase sigma factor [Polyangiaceae bacterium]|nr:RNA polymerase sigma factor [Polyangiaceae bacterium]
MTAHAFACIDSKVAPDNEPPDCDFHIHRAITAGDYRTAIKLCATTHGSAIGRLCMALVGSQLDAQDLAQETLVAAYTSLPNYRSDGSVRAFLFGIARHLCARHVETRSRREVKLRLVHSSQDGDSNSDGGAQDASVWLDKREKAERARTALATLRPTERDAVVLRFMCEMTFSEVAGACGVDEPTARKRVSRAIARLRTSLGDA